MADLDLTQEIRALRATFADIQHVVDVKKLGEEILVLKQQAADPNIWDEPVHAQSVTSKLSHAQGMLTKLESVQSRLDDLEVLIEMANTEADSSVQAEAKAELASLQALIS
jgi:peptide chain release factor 2